MCVCVCVCVCACVYFIFSMFDFVNSKSLSLHVTQFRIMFII